MKEEIKSIKLGANPDLDKAVYVWFCQIRLEGVPISGAILCEKAKQLRCKLNCNGPFLVKVGSGVFVNCLVSEVYQWRVKNCLLIDMQLNLLFPPSLNLSLKIIYALTRYLTVMRLVCNSDYYQTKH